MAHDAGASGKGELFPGNRSFPPFGTDPNLTCAAADDDFDGTWPVLPPSSPRGGLVPSLFSLSSLLLRRPTETARGIESATTECSQVMNRAFRCFRCVDGSRSIPRTQCPWSCSPSARRPFAPHFFTGNGFKMHYVDEGRENASNGTIILLHGEPTWGYLCVSTV